MDYIKNFKDSNPEIPDEFYGECLGRMTNRKRDAAKLKEANGPRAEDFGLPRTEDELNLMMKKMLECGFEKTKALEIKNERKV